MADATHQPPGLPEVRDEAADTPLWVPVLGLSLLVLLALVFVLRTATSDEPTGSEASSQEQTAPPEPGETPSAGAEPAAGR